MDIATLYMDTYKIVQLLQTKGYTKEEAEGFIEAIREINIIGVATKQDISDLRDELKEEIAEVRNELKQDIADLRDELKQDMNTLKGEMLKFQLIQTIALIGVMIALFQIY